MSRACFFAASIILLLSGLSHPAGAEAPPTLLLPSGALNQASMPGVTVTLSPNYSPTHIQFLATFDSVPVGYSIGNSTYSAWCVDPFSDFAANPPYNLISTYDTATLNNPPGGGTAQNPDWGAINWVLNNKPTTGDAPTWIVQQVIWKLLTGQFIAYAPGGGNYPAPASAPLALSAGDSTIANTLYAMAIAQDSFVPGPGQVVGVMLYVDGINPDGSSTISNNVVSQNNINPFVPPLNGLNGQPNRIQELLIEVTVAGPAVTCSAVNSGQVGVAFNSPAITVLGGAAPFTFSVATGTLPAGLTLNASTGAITGTPTAAGTFTIQVTDANGFVGTGNCPFTINPPPTASCVAINAVQGVAITPVTMTGSGGAGGPYTFSATGLPAGLTMASNGTISGTPTISGTFSYTVTVTDSAGNQGTVNCSLTVNAPPSASCVSINAVQGVAITPVTMTGSGGAGGPYTFSATGLPAGLTMASNGTISGTPTVTGTFNYTVTVTDSAGNKGTLNCSVTVNAPPSASCVSINAVQGFPITPVTMVGSGGAGGPYTFTATGLPAGLSMSTGGTISGTPTVSGTFSYTVTVKDKAGNTGTVNCSVTVNAPPTASCVVINAVQGVAITPVTMTGSGGAGGPYAFTATGLPAGLTMSASGTISGTPMVSGTFGYSVTVKDSAGNTGTVNCSVTVAPPALPGIAITKTASPTNPVPFQLVTFTYTVTNTGGTTLTNIVVTDDNGTPGNTSDDFTVGTIASLAPGASTTLTWTTYPPYTITATGTSGGTGIPGGSLTVQNTAMPAGCIPNVTCYLKVTLNQALTLNDNSYGANSSAGWTPAGKTHRFSDLTGSDQAEFRFYDSKGNLVLDFNVDYISSASAPSASCPNPNFTSYPSGYGTLGWCGGDGKLNSGNSSYIKGMDSTLTDDLNQSSAFYGYTTNSPAAGFPGWNFVDGYTVIIDPAVFGANGFGKVTIPLIHNSPSINGTDQITGTPGSSTSTNTATAVSASVSATGQATVTINVPVPPTPLALTFPSSPNGTVGTAYSVTLAATGGIGPYTYSVSVGTLPAGLTLNASTGAITGTPTTAVSGPAANITFKVTDSESPAVSATASGAINIAAPPKLSLPFPPGANGTVGTAYSVTLAATGGIGPYTYSVSAGTLPAGLTLNASTGAITGTPTTAVSGPAANITFKVTDSESPAVSATASGAINIAAPPQLKQG